MCQGSVKTTLFAMSELASGIFTLTASAADLYISLWPITILLFCLGVWGGVVLNRHGALLSGAPMIIVILMFLAWLSLSSFAVLFEAEQGVDSPTRVEQNLKTLHLLASGFMLAGMGVVAFTKSNRFPVLAIFLTGVWFNFGILIVAVMDVGGVRL